VTGTAAGRLTGLLEHTRAGHGLLKGSVTVDQVYAHYQHEALDLNHPRGGGAKYLERPLFEHYRDYLASLAASYLGGDPQREMARCMEHLSDATELAAPWEFGDLMHSGHPEVERGLEITYDRPPKRHRLTRPELRAKAALRLDRPDMRRLKGWIYWHNTVRGLMGLPPPRRGT
jgi:hypothetical protein